MSRDRHIIVDGYNVIYAWNQLDGVRKRSIDVAREQLVSAMQTVYESESIRMTVVFDGQGAQVSVERPSGDPAFSVVFSSTGISADAVIEQILRRSGKQTEVTVFSADNLVAAAVRACGGYLLTPEALREWVARCESDQHTALQRRRSRDARHWKTNSPWDALG